MRVFAALLSCFLHALASAAESDFPYYRYWAGNLPPDWIFASGLRPPGTNDNLQQVAQGTSCGIDGGTSSVAFVIATQRRTLAEANAARMSHQNPGQRFYVYRIRASSAWNPLAESLAFAYPNHFNGLRPLAFIHADYATWIHHGRVPPSTIDQATPFLNGERETTIRNSRAIRTTYLSHGGSRYEPEDRSYNEQSFISFARQNRLILDACTAQGFCNRTRETLLFSPTANQTCPNLRYGQMSAVQLLARLRLPIWLGFLPAGTGGGTGHDEL